MGKPKLPDTLDITFDAEAGTMSCPATPHTATRTEGGDWAVSWLPGRHLTRERARDAIRVAVLATLPTGDPRRCLIGDLAGPLGLDPDDAIVRASAPVGSALPPRLEPPRPGPESRPPVAAPLAHDLAAALIEAHAATVEAFAIPADLGAVAARRLLAARRDAVRLLIALDRPGLTAAGLLHDVARLRAEIARTDREIVEPERTRAAERAARAVARKAAKGAEPQVEVANAAESLPEIGAAPQADVEAVPALSPDDDQEPVAELRPVTWLDDRRLALAPASALPSVGARSVTLFDRELLREALRPRVLDLLARQPQPVPAHGVRARWSA
ncbi:hypothetical protein LO762_29355 [Actinocorallia sp. API 0066]|uniref:hypothetical protein n=1 Tax=Actinocorallia sp. API 0066 TaxID=2896846 RepID=UPI001E519F6E|nr:hypothetical protein [Actinocorallia sp. API 0066]MCD0453258.1 hypothetical protein [Actinocorallia sp. API 0066]